MSKMDQSVKYGLVIVIIAIIVAAGAILGISLLTNPPAEPPQTGEVNVQVINDDNTFNLNYSTLLTLTSIEGSSSYQNRFGNWRGIGTYIGAPLSSIVGLVGGMDNNDLIRVNATDGYSQYYTYDNLYPNSSFSTIQGDLVLAYSYNETTPTSWADGPQSAFIPVDGAFSNEDANQTTHPAFFFGSAGARWVRNVASIEVIHDVYIDSKFHVTIVDGDDERDVYLVDLALMNNLEGFTGYQTGGLSWPGNGTYRGVLISKIVELVTTIEADDIVKVIAADGYNQSFTHYNLYPNSTISLIQGDLILAYVFNGTMVTDWTEGPKIIFLAPDGAYSNTDASLTTEPAFFYGSAGSRCVKNVAIIEVIRNGFPP
ncbi:MAG: hypothetical protein ACFE9D_04300 [Promethearchaeota archaeon]